MKLVESMTKTVSSSQKSDLNSRYGTYDICQSMIKGNTNFSFEDTSDETDGKTVQIELLRSAADQKFFAQTSIDDKSFKLFVNKKTSLIYIDDMAVRIKYADNLITNMSNSPITTVLGLDNETVYTFGSAYENCMRLAANNYKEDNNIKTDVIEKTLKYFLDMQGDYEGSRDITVGDKSQKCKVYSVVFDVQDFYKYLDDCFGTHELDLQEVYDSLSKYMPDLETIDNAAVMVHDIKQFVDDILDGDNITFYFAINRSGELVTLYADDISDRKVSVNLSFSGTDYIAQSYELSVNIPGQDGRSFVFSKKDVTDGDEIGVSYRAKIDSARVSGNIEGGLDVLFWDDNAEINLKIGNAGIKKSALISGNKKGSSLDFKPPSMPISPNSFSISTTCWPAKASLMSFLIRVVLPAPRKPEKISILVMIQLPLSLNSTQSRRVLAQKSYTPIITRLSMGKRPFSRKNCNFFCKLTAHHRTRLPHDLFQPAEDQDPAAYQGRRTDPPPQQAEALCHSRWGAL